LAPSVKGRTFSSSPKERFYGSNDDKKYGKTNNAILKPSARGVYNAKLEIDFGDVNSHDVTGFRQWTLERRTHSSMVKPTTDGENGTLANPVIGPR